MNCLLVKALGPSTSDRECAIDIAASCPAIPSIVDSIRPPRSSHSYTHNVLLPHRRSRRSRTRTAPYPGRIAHPASQPGQNFQRRQRQACRRTRPSPRGELRGVHRQVSCSTIPAPAAKPPFDRLGTTGDCQSLPTLHSHTHPYAAQTLSIADVHLQSRYEKEFEGVQDVFELQVLSPI